jgi:hypothetical protein
MYQNPQACENTLKSPKFSTEIEEKVVDAEGNETYKLKYEPHENEILALFARHDDWQPHEKKMWFDATERVFGKRISMTTADVAECADELRSMLNSKLRLSTRQRIAIERGLHMLIAEKEKIAKILKRKLFKGKPAKRILMDGDDPNPEASIALAKEQDTPKRRAKQREFDRKARG